MPLMVRRKLTRWGNSLGFRVTKAEAERLGVHEGEELEVELFGPVTEAELDRLAMFRLGGDYDLDAILEEEMGGDP